MEKPYRKNRKLSVAASETMPEMTAKPPIFSVTVKVGILVHFGKVEPWIGAHSAINWLAQAF